MSELVLKREESLRMDWRSSGTWCGGEKRMLVCGDSRGILREGERTEWGLTSHIWSLYSIRELMASMARKLSSETSFLLSWSLRMLGLMTVARLWVSILLPVSSSTCEKDEAQTRKEKRISRESRWLFGSRQHVRWSTRRFFSSSAISIPHGQHSQQCTRINGWLTL